MRPGGLRIPIARLAAVVAVVVLLAATAAQTRAGEPITKSSSTTLGPITVSAIEAVFVPTKLATKYTVTANDTAGKKLTYRWELALERVDPADTSPPGYQHTDPNAANYASAAVDDNCNDSKLAGGKESTIPMAVGQAVLHDIIWSNLENEFTWYHGDKGAYPDDPSYGCDHTKMGPSGHQGVVYLTVTDGIWSCTAVISGSNLNVTPVYSEAPSCKNAYREHLQNVSVLVEIAVSSERRILGEIGTDNKEATKELEYWTSSVEHDAGAAKDIKDDPSADLDQAAKLDRDALKQDLKTKDGQTKALNDLAAALKLKKKALTAISAAISAQPVD